MGEKPKRERGTLLQWLATLAIIAVFGVVLYRGLVRDWYERGVPAWRVEIDRWEKRQRYEWALWWKYRNGTPVTRSSHGSASPWLHTD